MLETDKAMSWKMVKCSHQMFWTAGNKSLWWLKPATLRESQASFHKTCGNSVIAPQAFCRTPQSCTDSLWVCHSFFFCRSFYITYCHLIHWFLSASRCLVWLDRTLAEKHCLISGREGVKLMIDSHIYCPEEAAASIASLIHSNRGWHRVKLAVCLNRK